MTTYSKWGRTEKPPSDSIQVRSHHVHAFGFPRHSIMFQVNFALENMKLKLNQNISFHVEIVKGVSFGVDRTFWSRKSCAPGLLELALIVVDWFVSGNHSVAGCSFRPSFAASSPALHGFEGGHRRQFARDNYGGRYDTTVKRLNCLGRMASKILLIKEQQHLVY